MCDHGLIQPQQFGDLRDYMPQAKEVCVDPTDTILTVYTRMRSHGVSQLPVLRERSIVGIIDEWDLLKAIDNNRVNFQRSVNEFMSVKLETLQPDVPCSALRDLFDRDLVPINVENGVFLGLITKVDDLNYLRRQALL